MMRSMFSGVSGLRIHQTKMDVIANNISNVNTVGFKASRVTFTEIFSQTVSSASGENPATLRGGTNPMQIGLGANVASVDLLMTNGAAQRTDDPYHVMVQGEGMFVVSDGAGQYFTRAGAFRLDLSGNLTMPGGLLINGWKGIPDPDNPGSFKIDKTSVGPIQITGQDLVSSPEPTTAVKYEGNLKFTDGQTKDGIDTTISFFDSLGVKYTVDVKYKYHTDETATPVDKYWTMSIGNYMYPGGDKTKGVLIDVDALAGVAFNSTDPDATMDSQVGPIPSLMTITTAAQANPAAPAPFEYTLLSDVRLTFTDKGVVNQKYEDPDGTGGLGTLTGFIVRIDDAAETIWPKASFGVKLADPTDPTTIYDTIKINLSELTQYDSATDAMASPLDGTKSGELTEIAIGPDGKIVGNYSNGRTKVLAQLVLAKFRNYAGLQKTGDNLYISTVNSGEPNIGDPQDGGTSLLGGVLEMSNVDLSYEFTEMITTQRGFQANSRIITTSDDMLQELVNLKR